MATGAINELRAGLARAATPGKAEPMAAYMKDHFEFLGVTAPDRRRATKVLLANGKTWSSDQLVTFAEACWEQPEREIQYVGTDLLVRWAKALEPEELGRIERLIRAKSWWDTVDALASNVVGPMVATTPALVLEMDDWILDDDMWIARTATIHQLKFRERTDTDRLFGYIDERCDSTEFFMRKAQGWALREYAKTDPDAVRTFVVDRGERLSGLTRREALKHL